MFSGESIFFDRVATNLENLENSGNLKNCENLRENSGKFEFCGKDLENSGKMQNMGTKMHSVEFSSLELLREKFNLLTLGIYIFRFLLF